MKELISRVTRNLHHFPFMLFAQVVVSDMQDPWTFASSQCGLCGICACSCPEWAVGAGVEWVCWSTGTAVSDASLCLWDGNPGAGPQHRHDTQAVCHTVTCGYTGGTRPTMKEPWHLQTGQ